MMDMSKDRPAPTDLIALKEITDWDTPNHCYLVGNGRTRLYAYRPTGTKVWIECKKPMTFSTSRRKFTTVTNKEIKYA